MPARVKPTPRSTYATATLATVYFGVLFGVSFVAVPAKFLATTLTLAQTLDVGRATFWVFGWVEGALLVGLSLSALRSRTRWAVGVVLLLALVQATALRPLLDQRLGVILEGGQPPPSHLHTLYGFIELVKLCTLGAIAWCNRPTPR